MRLLPRFIRDEITEVFVRMVPSLAPGGSLAHDADAMSVSERFVASTWLVIGPESFSGEELSRLRELGLEVDEVALTVRAPFGPTGSVGARVMVRNGRALYVAGGGSGTYRVVR